MVQVQREGERDERGRRLEERTERGGKLTKEERGTWRETCGRRLSTTWETHTSKSYKNTEKHAHTFILCRKSSTLFLLLSVRDLDQNTCRECVYTARIRKKVV